MGESFFNLLPVPGVFGSFEIAGDTLTSEF